MEWVQSVREAINYIEENITKAFSRFHGVTPTEVRRGKAMVKSFAPLKIKFSLEGGFIMEYRIVEKDEFKVVGVGGKFKYETAVSDIQGFWHEYNLRQERPVQGMYGVNMDEKMGGSEFEYYIADNFIRFEGKRY
ncbi:MAG: GyrI-like domain-containing protein [Clostridium sp.]|nr:GyrI-like domain-containing protein [Clostridium sp.]